MDPSPSPPSSPAVPAPAPAPAAVAGTAGTAERGAVGTALAAAFARAVRADPQRVAEVSASLHRVVHDADGLADLVDRAVRAAVQWLPHVDFAGVTVQLDRTPLTLAGSDPVVQEVDRLQHGLEDGPCLTAMRTAALVTADAVEVARRWPRLAAGAQRHGVASYLAVPLVVDGVGRGSINLYSRSGSGFPGREVDLLAVLCDYVSRGLADYTALRSAEVHSAHLQVAMAGRAPIEQAKGILMAVHQVTADAAFELLRVQSQRTNTKLRDVAAAFVAAQARLPFPEPDAGAPVAAGVASGAGDYQSAFDHAPVGMAIATPDGELLTVNPALADLLGGTPRDLVGTMLLDATHPDDVRAARAALLAGERRSVAHGARVRGASGEWVPLTVSTATVLAGSRTAAHLVVHVHAVGAAPPRG